MDERSRNIDRYLDGELDASEVEELLVWVGSDPAHADLFARHCLLDEHARELLDGGGIEPASAPGSTETGRWKRWIMAVAAAVVVLVGGLSAYQIWFSQDKGKDLSDGYVAVIAQSVGGYQEGDKPVRPGESLGAGLFALDRGVVRLDFTSGAQIAVEGPARLEIVDEMRVVLKRGILTATVSPSASGFVVDTATARIVDLGTAFGVAVEEDGQTDVCVFDGLVEVNRQGADASTRSSQRVREGESVRASSDSTTIESVAFETGRFERAWPVNSGILQATGSMRFVAPGPSFDPGKYEDNEHILIFAEQKNVQLETPIRVGQSDPGEFRLVPFEQTKTIPAGQRVSSYLLQLKSAWTEEHELRRRRVVGQVTFAEPIVGLISRNRFIRETETLFGSPKIKYESPSRSVEPRPMNDQRKGFDTIILAADRRTLILDLQECPDRIDQLRVLVEAP